MHLGVSYNGSTPVSKTVNAGSIPAAPATCKIKNELLSSFFFNQLNNMYFSIVVFIYSDY